MIKKNLGPAAQLDAESILKDARRELTLPSRRLFAKRALTLGGLSLLTGCNITDQASVNRMLERISRMNDGVQGWLFDPKRLAPTYTQAEMTRPFPFNAFYGIEDVPDIDGSDYRLEILGLVANKRPWTLEQLHKMPQNEQITRHICVEGWSAIGRWGGIPFSYFLKMIGADTSAKYIDFQCGDDYHTSIDMATALHPQTQLTLTYDGQILPAKYGFPMKLRMPTKLGYKNPKHIVSMEVTNKYPGGYWEDQGYNWFGGS